jgi:hypothetical protein
LVSLFIGRSASSVIFSGYAHSVIESLFKTSNYIRYGKLNLYLIWNAEVIMYFRTYRSNLGKGKKEKNKGQEKYMDGMYD